MSLASLNSSGVQTSNPALYQSITDLIKQTNELSNSLNSQIAAIQAIIDSYGIIVNLNQFELTKSAPLLIDGGQIKFPITENPSTDVNTLDDYEEGIFTPTDGSGAGLVFASAGLLYIKIGRLVAVQGQIIYPATANALPAIINLLPFINTSTNGALELGYYSGPSPARIWVQASAITAQIMNGGAAYTNAALSGVNFTFSGIYVTTQ